MDFREVREILGCLAYQDSLEFQARKVNLATSTPKDFQDHLDLKVCLVHPDTRVIMEHQVPQVHQVYEDRKEKVVRCHFLGTQGYQDVKVTRGSQVSQASLVGACPVSQVHMAFLVPQDKRVIVVLDTLAPLAPPDHQEMMGLRGL